MDEIEENADTPDSSENEDRGVTTPKKKRRRRGELSKAEREQPSQKHFQPSWLQMDEFKGWLEAVEGEPMKAHCKACRSYLQAGKSDLEKHAETKKHQKSVKGLKGVKNIAQAFDPAAMRAKAAADKKFTESVKSAEIKFAAFFAEHNLSIMTSDHLVELCKAVFPDSKIAQNITLDRTKCTAVLQNVLAPVEKDKIAEDLRKCHFSILIDESTDKGNLKNLCLLVKYVSPSTGKVCTPLLEMIELDSKDCTAEAIFNRVVAVFERLRIPMANIIGMACDNAPVMVGKHNSFYSRLKTLCPWLVLMNCICHSSAIASSKACAKLPSNVLGLARKLANYVSGSPKRSAILEEFQEFYHVETLKLINPSKTRWLVLHPCITRILDNLVPLVQFLTMCSLEDKKDSDAPALLQDLQNPFVKAYLHFLKYTLEYFNRLNAMFQSEKVLIHRLKELSMNLLTQVCQNYMRANVLPSVATIDVANPHYLMRLENMYLGPGVEEILASVPVPTDPQGKMTNDQLKAQREHDIKGFRLRCLDFYTTAAQQMQTYLPLNDKVIDEARFVSPNVALSGDARTEDLPHLSKIASTFKDTLQLDTDALMREWREMPYDIPTSLHADLKALQPDEFWGEIEKMRDFSDKPKFPQLVKLSKAVLALPHSNADAERVFTIVTDSKTKKRNRMGNATLDSICVVRTAMKLKKVCCYNFPVEKVHLSKHNKEMYKKH